MSVRVPVVLQTANTDCGPACLAMLLRAHGRAASLSQVRDELDPGRDGVSALDLRDVGTRLGLPMRARRIAPDDLTRTGLGGFELPAIAHWSGQHFVLVERADRRGVQLVDPAVGRRRVDRARFAESASGVFLTAGRIAKHNRRGGSAGNGRVALLRRIAARHKAALAGVLITSLLLTLFGLATPLATAACVTALSRHRPMSMHTLVVVVVLAALSAVVCFARAAAITVAQRSMARYLAVETVSRLLCGPYRFLARRDAGDLVSRVSAADIVRDALSGSMIGAGIDGALSVGYVGIVVVEDPVLGTATAALLVAQLFCAVLVARRTRLLRHEEVLAEGRSTSRLAETVTGFASVRAAGAEQTMLDRWHAEYRSRLAASIRRMRAGAVSDAVITATRISAPVLLMLLATRTAAHDPGRAIGLSVLAAASLAPVGTLAAELRALQELGPMIDRLLDIAEAPKEQPVALPAFPPLRGEVTLERVDFRYDARSPLALEQISLTVPPGSKLGVVGNSGSGKSTLSLLLAMLYQPSAGRLLLDGLDPYAHDLASLRRQIGVVLQTPFLIAGTIRENIAFGTRGLRDDDIERAAAAACIHDEIMTMPNGYDTVLAEHGAGVSGGQAQRIMLARALARRPAILVLDEATSALDPITEAAVEANLRQLTMTRIVIAHRLSTVIDSDQLVVLDGGRVVEQGRPAELVSVGGYFARLVGADRARTNQS